MADNIGRVLVVSCSSFLSSKDVITGKKFYFLLMMERLFAI